MLVDFVAFGLDLVLGGLDVALHFFHLLLEASVGLEDAGDVDQGEPRAARRLPGPPPAGFWATASEIR